MGTILVTYVTTKDTAHVQEYHLYGSSRLGTYTPQANDQGKLILGLRNYELTNHLGNVLAVISDKKKEDLTADIVSASDYYPFGMPLKSRNFEKKKYRFGFNGKEKDDEIAGEGNSIHYEYREYDTRIARFKSIDPRSPDYAWQSPYVYHRNNPINSVDYLGLGDPPTLNWDYFSSRHMLSGDFSANTPKGGINSTVTNPAWQSKTVIEGFFNEALALAKETGKIETNVTLKNGTTWSINTNSGHFNPVSGEGITNLSNSEVAALRAAKKGGSGEAVFSNLAKNKSLGTYSSNMQKTLTSLAEIEGVSSGTALKHIGGNMPSTSVSSGQSSAAQAKFGSAGKYVKWGGRALLVVAVASDVYEVYNSENKPRTITKKVGGWTGAIAAGSATGAGLTATGIDFTGPWGWAAHGLITVGAGVGGYFAGEYVTETVYDWIFTKEE